MSYPFCEVKSWKTRATPTNQVPHFGARHQYKPHHIHTPVYPRLRDPRVGLPNVLEQMREHVRLQALLQIAYVRGSLPVSNRPKVTTHVSRFLQTKDIYFTRVTKEDWRPFIRSGPLLPVLIFSLVPNPACTSVKI